MRHIPAILFALLLGECAYAGENQIKHRHEAKGLQRGSAYGGLGTS